MANKPMNRKDLSLGEKVAVIKELESKTSQRVVAEKYSIMCRNRQFRGYGGHEKRLRTIIATTSIPLENVSEKVRRKMWKTSYYDGSSKPKQEECQLVVQCSNKKLKI